MSAHQSARAYTLAEIDAMREALLRRKVASRWAELWPSHGLVTSMNIAPSAYERERYGPEVERELQTVLVGNVEPAGLIASCPAFWKPEEEAAQ